MNVSFLDLPPLQRLGLFDPSSQKLLLLACAHRVYHAIKFQHLEFALSAHAPGGDPIRLYELILELALFHLKDVGFPKETATVLDHLGHSSFRFGLRQGILATATLALVE